MNITKMASFHIIGISVKTSNLNGQSAKDIPALWEKFMSEQLVDKIPNKLSEEFYCIYTNYEGDHTAPYMTLLGCKVDSLEDMPEGFTGMTFSAANYQQFTAKGNLMEGAVWQTWEKIWATDLKRTFIADFEVYGEKAQNPADAEVVILVGVE